MMLKRSQLLGRNTIYNQRYKKKLIKADKLRFLQDPLITNYIRHPLNGKPLMVVRTHSTQELKLPAILGTRKGQSISDLFSKLADVREGTTVCCITEPKKNVSALVSPGCKGTYQGKIGGKLVVRAGRRQICFTTDAICFKGIVAGADAAIKPILKAGTGALIKRKLLKKYPKVSSHKMNVVQSQSGGSSRKKRGAPMTISRRASPGSKSGNIAASRTGRRKK